MNKRLRIGLVPLLAIAALAVAGAPAQAAPHVYQNGVMAPEGEKVGEIVWGVFKTASGPLGEIQCHTVWAGYLENPPGGAAAQGRVQAFDPYDCEDPACIALGGKAPQLSPIPTSVPWLTEVLENTKKEFREKLGFKGAELHKKPTTPGFIDLEQNCEGIGRVEMFGELNPLMLNNGKSIGASPSQLEFDKEETNPEFHNLEAEVIETYPTTALLKLEGYTAQELIAVKNP